jgi:hypothetical protein
MPRFDGTGPWGLGPGTGWGLGPCGAGRAWRRGWGRGLGFGRGLGWRRFWGYPHGPYPYQPQITKKEEKELLEEEMANLEEELKAIKARLAELKDQK